MLGLPCDWDALEPVRSPGCPCPRGRAAFGLRPGKVLLAAAQSHARPLRQHTSGVPGVQSLEVPFPAPARKMEDGSWVLVKAEVKYRQFFQMNILPHVLSTPIMPFVPLFYPI